MTVVSTGFTIWTEDICLQGFGPSKVEKKSCKEGKKNKKHGRNPRKTHRGWSPRSRWTEQMSLVQTNAQTSFKSDTVDLILDS